MTHHARGTFEVKITPMEQPAADKLLNLWTLEKTISGDLTGTSRGNMVAFGTPGGRSAAYTALEAVNGKLAGRSGTFILQHQGTMAGPQSQMTVTIVPDSGTDELATIRGTLTIIIENGKHSYDLEYTLD